MESPSSTSILVLRVCNVFSSLHLVCLCVFVKARLCSASMVQSYIVRHQTLLCTTDVHGAPWCTRGTYFKKKAPLEEMIVKIICGAHPCIKISHLVQLSAWLRSGCPLVFHRGHKNFCSHRTISVIFL